MAWVVSYRLHGDGLETRIFDLSNKLPNRINHYAAKTIDSVSRSDKENLLSTILVLVFSAVLAYAGYKSHGILFVMSIMVAVASALILLLELFIIVKTHLSKDDE